MREITREERTGNTPRVPFIPLGTNLKEFQKEPRDKDRGDSGGIFHLLSTA